MTKRYNIASGTLMGTLEHPEGSFVHWNDYERLSQLRDWFAERVRVRQDGRTIIVEPNALVWDNGLNCVFPAHLQDLIRRPKAEKSRG